MAAGRALMFQGTGSDVGKSTLVAGLARALVRRGLRVRPFKPQNMSNNAAVTADGGEIGRAQALQAQACRVPASVHMNPVLLKPEGMRRSQLVVQGQRVGTLEAKDFLAKRAPLMPAILDSFGRVAAEADIVLVEGAGSASEVNLRARDIANWGFARAAGVPVVLVGDIDRGGVIASLVGTKVVLEAEDAALVRGFLINKLRGDASLVHEGTKAIEAHTGWPCLGVVPWIDACAALPAEDGVVLEHRRPRAGGPDHDATVVVTVLRLPSISNFDDLDPLAAEPGLAVRYLAPGQALPAETRVAILPGSKATRADLAFLRAQGWDVDLLAHARRGGYVLGLCGGYQMLGREICDPAGLEGAPGASAGLGLLDVTTTLDAAKTLARVTGVHASSGLPLEGYEIHLGRTTGAATEHPFAHVRPRGKEGEPSDPTVGAEPDLATALRPDGAIDPSGRIWGTYLHGVFAADELRRACLATWGASVEASPRFATRVEAAIDALADAVEAHVDVAALLAASAR